MKSKEPDPATSNNQPAQTNWSYLYFW